MRGRVPTIFSLLVPVLGLLAAPSLVRAEGPAAAETAPSGVDRSTFDPSVRAQDDLFRHVNGGWIKATDIPADLASYGSFMKLRDDAEAHVRAIVEETAAHAGEHPEGSEARKIADLFASFMDEDRAEALGITPIQPVLDAAAAASASPAGVFEHAAKLQAQGVNVFFSAYVDTDAKKSDQYILTLNQGGLGLPDRSYYLEDKYEKVREAYRAHVAKMFVLAGRTEADAKADADRVLAFETKLATTHWDRVKTRDATLTYNKFDRKDLAKLAPGLEWGKWFFIQGVLDAGTSQVIVGQPEAFTGLAALIAEMKPEDARAYLQSHVLRASAPYLSKAFVDENFAFYGKTLTGVPENRPRWKRGVGVVEMALGEAAGRLYVEKHFPPEAKEKMKGLVQNLIAAYRQSIEGLDWMGPETKAKALVKLEKFTPKIGYPDKWRDYSALEIKPNDLVGNVRRAIAFEHKRNLAKLGQPVDRSEWMMTPQTVNAYYNPGMNEIVFPAAILRPPFFDLKADDAVNYGGIGAVIGHEIGHGFDDQGSKFDGDGNLTNWWTDADRSEFDKRSAALIEQYNSFEPAQLPGQKVNGALTIGENIGDLGGLTIAHKAYLLSLDGANAPEIDGLTGPQRVFIGWAQVWRSKYRDAELERRLTIDPHSPPEFRCNGVLRNLPEFHQAFGVKEGDRLWLPPEKRVRIW
jgi:putative endopeptidase